MFQGLSLILVKLFDGFFEISAFQTGKWEPVKVDDPSFTLHIS